MIIEEQPVTQGQVLQYLRPGNKVYREGMVLDINEHVKAVKLQIATGKKVHSEWFSASILRRPLLKST